MPDIQISYITLAIAVLANFFFGFIWFKLLFGRMWAIEMGYDPEAQPEKSKLMRSFGLMIVGNILLVWVFAHNIAVWDPKTWGLATVELPRFSHAITAAFYTWLGFFVPMHLAGAAWENKSCRLFVINSGFHLLSLMLVASILIYF